MSNRSIWDRSANTHMMTSIPHAQLEFLISVVICRCFHFFEAYLLHLDLIIYLMTKSFFTRLILNRLPWRRKILFLFTYQVREHRGSIPSIWWFCSALYWWVTAKHPDVASLWLDSCFLIVFSASNVTLNKYLFGHNIFSVHFL